MVLWLNTLPLPRACTFKTKHARLENVDLTEREDFELIEGECVRQCGGELLWDGRPSKTPQYRQRSLLLPSLNELIDQITNVTHAAWGREEMAELETEPTA